MSMGSRQLQQTMRLSDETAARIQWIFYGSNGIRAGWSALIFAVIFLAPILLAQLAF